MKIKAKTTIKDVKYPTTNAFKAKSNKIFMYLAIAGISTGVISNIIADDTKKTPPQKNKINKSNELKEKETKINQLIALLGAKEFQIREKATFALITMGKSKEKELKNLIEKLLKPKLKDKDVEVRTRTKKILAAFKKTKSKYKINIIKPQLLGGDICVEPVQVELEPAPKRIKGKKKEKK